jgi:hypothetical protein
VGGQAIRETRKYPHAGTHVHKRSGSEGWVGETRKGRSVETMSNDRAQGRSEVSRDGVGGGGEGRVREDGKEDTKAHAHL